MADKQPISGLLIRPNFLIDLQKSFDVYEIIRLLRTPHTPWSFNMSELQKWVTENCDSAQLADFVVMTPGSNAESFVDFAALEFPPRHQSYILVSAVLRMESSLRDLMVSRIIKICRERLHDRKLSEVPFDKLAVRPKKSHQPVSSTQLADLAMRSGVGVKQEAIQFLMELVKWPILNAEQAHHRKPDEQVAYRLGWLARSLPEMIQPTAEFFMELGLTNPLLVLLNDTRSADIGSYQSYILTNSRPSAAKRMAALGEVISVANWDKVDQDGLSKAIIDAYKEEGVDSMYTCLEVALDYGGVDEITLHRTLANELPGRLFLQLTLDVFLPHSKWADYGLAIDRCIEDSTGSTRQDDIDTLNRAIASSVFTEGPIGRWVQVAKFINQYGSQKDLVRFPLLDDKFQLAGPLKPEWSSAILSILLDGRGS